MIPGGLGLGAVLPYGTLRRIAAKRGLDLIMVEHRGVGLSRRGISGTDLPFSGLRVDEVADDIAAVLDWERVAGMLLDSALQSATICDVAHA